MMIFLQKKKKSENQDIIWGDNLKEDGRIAK